MRTHNQANIERNLNGNTLLRPSPLRRTVAWLTLIAYIGQPMIVTAQVIADQAAAASKRPVIDTTANGIPLVQIATPNAAGLSHNQYTQFNVDPAGLILNNSSTTVLTQQAGYVAGNQNLANGAASVILNEVTSTSRSQLNGYIEVAGQQAQVIVANPNGITCNGCGFINTSRGVLTTGTPVLGTSGSLDSLRVTGGDIQIGAAGLNAGNISQLDLIARSVQVNGQLWANNLNVITGANLVNYNNLGVQIIAGDANKPTVGIDVALLGGMYANKIRLVGTEAGVGVNSLGNIAAQAGDFTLNNQGLITLAGTISASGNININGAVGSSNSGTLYSKQNVSITDQGTIRNSGILSAQGNLSLNGANIDSSGSLGSGIDINGIATKTGSLSLTATNRIDATGPNMAGSNLSFSAATINLANSNTNAADNMNFNAGAGDILFDNGVINATGTINAMATGMIGNDNGIVIGNGVTFQSGSFSNRAGQIGASAIDIGTGLADNSGGKIIANQLNLTAANLNNRAGYLAHTGTGPASLLIGNALDNTGGWIQSNATSFSLTPATLNNTNGHIVHSGTGLFTINTGTVSNNGGSIRTNGQSIITAGGIGNQGGVLSSVKQATLTGTLDNSAGGYIGADTLTIVSSAGAVSNSTGTIEAVNGIDLTAQSLNNAGGSLKNLGSTTALNTPALLRITTSQGIINTALNGVIGFIGGNGQLSVSTASLDNTGGKIFGNSLLTLQTGGGLVNQGGSIQTNGDLDLITGAALNNRSGTIEEGGATGAFMLSASSIDNSNAGQIANLGTGATVINGGTQINNSDGTIGANGNLTINAANLLNNQAGTTNGRILSGNNLTLGVSNSLSNTNGGKIYAAGNLDFIRAGATLNNTAGNISSSGNSTFNLASVDNQGGKIASANNLDLTVNGLNANGTAALNGLGDILANGNAGIGLQGDYTVNVGNNFDSNGNLTLKVAGNLTNQTNIEALGTLTLTAASFTNQAGASINSGHTVVSTAGDITNNGRIDGTLITTSSNNLVNNASIIGNIIGITANNLNNNSATAVIGATTQIDLWVANALDNLGGAEIYSMGNLNIAANNAMNAGGNYTNLTQSIVNESSRIEAGGSINIGAMAIDNRRPFVTPLTTVTTAISTLTPPLNYSACISLPCTPRGLATPATPPSVRQFFTQDMTGVTANSFNVVGNDPVSGKPVVYFESKVSMGYGYQISTRVLRRVNGSTTFTIATQVIPQASIASMGTPSAQIRNPSTRLLTSNWVKLKSGQTIFFGTLDKQGNYFNISYYPGYDPAVNVLPSQLTPSIDVRNEISRTLTTTTTTLSSPASLPGQSQIVASGNINLNVGNTLNNYLSTIAAGNNLTISGTTTAMGPVTNTQLGNTALALTKTASTTGTAYLAGWNPCGGSDIGTGGGSCYVTGVVGIPPTTATTTPSTIPSSVTAGNTVSITAGRITNTVATGTNNPIAGTTLGGTQTAPGATGTGAPRAAQNPNTGITASNTGGQPAIALPTSGLYSINTQPGQNYLVVTDPRFTSYRNFISSDYMLSRLALDPGLIQKRLGDGFYEQQLVTDQVTQLTGRRFLGQYASAEDEFKALMDSGVATAKEFRLVPGVELTKTQVAALTSDIVWMVEEKVKLPDGSTTSVLAPKLYLCKLHAGDLQASGALIAAEAIDLNVIAPPGKNPVKEDAVAVSDKASVMAPVDGSGQKAWFSTKELDQSMLGMNGAPQNGALTGSIQVASAEQPAAMGTLLNMGTIRANRSLSIRAGDIVNRTGNIDSQGDLKLNAGNDIRNESGTISGNTVTLNAGHGIVNRTLIQSIQAGNASLGASNTAVGGIGTISAIGNLDMNATSDITITGALVKAGGNASLFSGGNFTVDTIKIEASSHSSTGMSYDSKQISHLTSGIQTGGNLKLTGVGDVALTSAQITNGGDGTVLAGGNLTIDSAKNINSVYEAGGGMSRNSYDETVLNSNISTGGNAKLAAIRLDGANSSILPRTDGKGNIALVGANISATGKVQVAADNNIDVRTVDEKHSLETTSSTRSHGFLTTTNTTTRDYVARTDAIGSSLGGNSVAMQAGKDLSITGSKVVAENDVSMAALRNVVISAGTNTRTEDHYRHETTTGFQITNGSFTDIGPDITAQAHLDAAKQSDSQSLIQSNKGNINVLAGHNLVVIGSQLHANAREETRQDDSGSVQAANEQHSGTDATAANSKGQINLSAGSTLALYAGQDTYKTDSSIIKVTNDNPFSKQKRTITDSTANLDYFGSQLSGNSLTLQSGGDSVLQAANLASGLGGTRIDAGGDLQLLAALNVHRSTHTETLRTDGIIMSADGGIDGAAVRRLDKKIESQNTTALLTQLTSAGNIKTHSGGDTTLEATVLDAAGSIDLSATGYAATTNKDGTTNAGRDGKILFKGVKETSYYSVTDSHNSTVWQGSSGGGQNVDTLKLASIKAGKGLTVDAKGGIEIDIPEVQATPAPTPQYDAKGPSTGSGQAKLIPPVVLTPEQQVEQRKADLSHALDTLASKPGQEWIGQLAKQDNVKFNQVKLAAEHWNYAHDGLTPEGAAIVVIVVTYFTAGAASGAAGAMTGAAAGTTTVASAALAVGMTTLASQAAVSLINNKGDLGQTLNDLGSSQNVKSLVTAMVTAGALQGLNTSLNIGNTSMGSINAQQPFFDQLQKNLIDNVASATINTAINGGSLESNLANSLKTAFIDTGAAQGANGIGDLYQNHTLNDFTHILAHAIAGCAAGAARSGDCSSGALGAAVGELSAQLYGGARLNSSNLDIPALQTDTVNFARMMAGIAVALTGGDANAINLAANAGGNAAQNNWAMHMGSFNSVLAGCSGSNSQNCQTARQMTGVRSSMPVDVPGIPNSKVTTQFDANNNVVSYTLVDPATNQATMIMQPAEFMAYANAPATTQAMMQIAPQWSLDIGSTIIYAGQGDNTRALQSMGNVLTSPDYWLTAATTVVGVATIAAPRLAASVEAGGALVADAAAGPSTIDSVGASAGSGANTAAEIGVPVSRSANPLSPVQQVDGFGNEIYYRTMSEEQFQYLERTGQLPPTTETSISPFLSYSSKYNGVTVQFTTAPGTSAQLQEIGIAANPPAAAQLPDLSTQTGPWMQTNVRFKVEGGQMTTQLGQGSGINIFNQNMIQFQKLP